MFSFFNGFNTTLLSSNRTMKDFIFRLIMIMLFLRLAMYLLLFIYDYTPDYTECNTRSFLTGNSYDNCVIFVKN